MVHIPSWVYRAGVPAALLLAAGGAVWRVTPQPQPVRAVQAWPFGGAPRALADVEAASPAPSVAAAGESFGVSPDLRAATDFTETLDPAFASGPVEILALAPIEARAASPFETLEPLLPPIRPRFDDLIEKTAPLPPRRPRELGLTAEAPRTVLASLGPTFPVREAPPAASVAPLPAPDLSVPQGPAGTGQLGSPVFVRIFKKEGTLELFVRRNGRFALKKTFEVCKMSGRVGPKLKSGDYQAPEGFYSVTARQLNPNSQYHLAFNVGYPNAFDRQNGRTGSAIMVHGDCVSIGCFAMTNKGIEEIYGYVAAALKNGQREVPVHIFPFRMSESAIARETGGGGFASLFTRETDAAPSGSASAQWGSFWRDLKQGHDLFEKTGEPPLAYACRGRYAFAPGPGCQRIAGW